MTSRALLLYVEREAGGQAVKRLLSIVGLGEIEERLRDENHWFSYETKLALWAAAEEVLEDPRIAEHVGAAVLELSVGMGLKRTLRALGSPAFVYGNVVRANSKFNWAHELTVLEKGATRVQMRYCDQASVGYHRYDCEYTKALLATVPKLFGLPPAHVTHSICGARGGSCCEFDVRWVNGTQQLRRVALTLAVGGAALAGGLALGDPALLPVAGGVLAAGELTIAARAVRFMQRRLDVLELRVNEQDDAAVRLLSSLEDLSSDLQLDEVLDKVSRKAQTAVGGKEFALLLDHDGTMRPDRHSGIPAASLSALAAWAQSQRESLLRHGTIVVDDLAADPRLAEIPLEEHAPFGSICAAPLIFRDSLLGVLVALAHGSTVFLPGDGAALSAYAGHAAIALANAHLVNRLEHQAAEDPLTGLANTRAFYQRCAAELNRAQRTDGAVAIAMIDIDYFKAINDRHGHLYGDQVLQAVAEALRAVTRKHDTVARMGGEEFAILMPDTHASSGYELAERARAAVARVPLATGTLSCSAGVASSSSDSPAELVALADSALYQAKRTGRNRAVIAAQDRISALATERPAPRGSPASRVA